MLFSLADEAQLELRAATPQPGPQAAAQSPKAGPAKKKRRSRYTVPTYSNPSEDDIPDFDDPVVRAAAVEALGRRNGTVVAVNPNTGRILAIVNQKLAYSAGFQPCSTFKPVVAAAALEEGLISRDTMVRVGPRHFMNLTEAMARSNNPYFEVLGRQMGFETLSRYARQFGLGELAGLALAREQPGSFPAGPPANGGVGRMSSFGEGIQITPLQLASLASTFANGGTVYYLQYPREPWPAQNFTPRVKRKLSIGALLPDVREGLLATVLYGTARSIFNPDGDQLLGKTGTCSENGSRLGWFVSYADHFEPRIVLVVLLRGGSSVNGPTAAEVAGRIYEKLRTGNYFAGPGAFTPHPQASYR